jgi:hypothetical protein
MKFKSLLHLLIFSISLNILHAQDGLKFQDQFKIDISKASSPIKIDGLLDEETWTAAKETENFWRKWPNDIGLPRRQTYVKMSYDDNFLYIAFKAMDTNYYVAQTQALTKIGIDNTVPGGKTGSTGQEKKRDTTYDDILTSLKRTRDATINATGGAKELMRVLGGKKDLLLLMSKVLLHKIILANLKPKPMIIL